MTEFNWLSELGIVGLALVALIITLVIFYRVFSKKLDSVTPASVVSANGYVKRDEMGKLHEKINTIVNVQNSHCAQQLARCNDQFSKGSSERATLITLVGEVQKDITDIKLDMREIKIKGG